MLEHLLFTDAVTIELKMTVDCEEIYEKKGMAITSRNKCVKSFQN